MPIGIGELTRLEYLSEFVVWKGSGLHALAGLHQQLRGELLIRFRGGIGDENECNWKLPICVQELRICRYLGVRIPDWSTINGVQSTNNHLTFLSLELCYNLKCLPPLHCLLNLRSLFLRGLSDLEFVEAEEDYSTSSSSPYLPHLEKLTQICLPVVKRWRRTTATPLAFPLLSHLHIRDCQLLELASFPQCPLLQKLDLWDVDNDCGMQRPPLPSTLFFPSVSPPPLEDVRIYYCKWMSSLHHEATASLRRLWISRCSGLKSLQLVSPHLQQVWIQDCEGLVSLEATTPSLRELIIRRCKEFKNLITGAPLNALKRLAIMDCLELDFLELELDWESLVNLRTLRLRPMPPTENIPLSLRNHQALGAFRITR